MCVPIENPPDAKKRDFLVKNPFRQAKVKMLWKECLMKMKFSHGIINCEKSRLMECWFNEILSGAIFFRCGSHESFLIPTLSAGISRRFSVQDRLSRCHHIWGNGMLRRKCWIEFARVTMTQKCGRKHCCRRILFAFCFHYPLACKVSKFQMPFHAKHTKTSSQSRKLIELGKCTSHTF